MKTGMNVDSSVYIRLQWMSVDGGAVNFHCFFSHLYAGIEENRKEAEAI